MPAAEYVATRSDGHTIGKSIRELVRLMLDEGKSWAAASDAIGLKRSRAARALSKPHVRAYMRDRRRELIEVLSARIPHRLSELMDSENAAAAVRASLALAQLNDEAQTAPATQIRTGGIIIQLVADEPRALPQAAPQIELKPVDNEERLGARD